MSVKGEIETKCPGGCEPFEAEVWSIVNGDQSPVLREAALACECNLLICPGCGKPFFPQESFVYFESKAEILAVVLPESFRGQEDDYRKKIVEDSKHLRKVPGFLADTEPHIFVGPEGLSELLSGEDYRREEGEVMRHFAEELGLELYHVSPKAAREKGLPTVLPFAPEKGMSKRAGLVAGLKRLVKANDALKSYKGLLEELLARPDQPPPPERIPR